MNSIIDERAREIALVLDFYHEKFTEYLAVVIAFTEVLPEEINNHIRNAFTHLSRANQAHTIADVQQECLQAKRHIERANRDCLKASIIKARVELDNLIADVVFYHGFLTPSMKASYNDISLQRKTAYRLETMGDGNQTEKLEEILRMTMALSDQVREHYSVAGRKRTKAMRLIKRWFRPIGFIITLFVGTALGVVLKDQVNSFIDALLN